MKYFNVGKIVNTHGINGEVRVISKTDFPEERYKKGATLYLFLHNQQQPVSLRVKSWRKHKNFDLLMFDGYDSINAVESFKDGILKVAEEQLDELQLGEYYFHEIIGCKVKKMNGEIIGTVQEILTPGANDVWVVRDDLQNEYLIPYIDAVVKEVNTKEKLIWIEPMEGLL